MNAILGLGGLSLKAHLHKAQYYETDQMGVIHHTNYIRWFEEARVSYLEQIGFGYDQMETAGVMCPVLAVTCDYHAPVRFGETVRVEAVLRSLTGLKFSFDYRIYDVATASLRCSGSSKHCFVGSDGKPMRLQKNHPNIYALFQQEIEA